MAKDEIIHHSKMVTLPKAVVEQDAFNIDTLEVVNFPLSVSDRHKLKDLMQHPVVYNTDENKNAQCHYQLHHPVPELTFPLNEEDKTKLLRLLAAFLVTPNCAGLAAPQIGINKAALIYRIEDDTKDLRKDFTHSVPITLLLNSHYEAITDEKTTDWEGCFSVENKMGEVDRFKSIKVTAYNSEGRLLEFDATGFEARLIQHETDHNHGILFIDRFQDHNKRGSYEEMRPLRIKDIEKWKNATVSEKKENIEEKHN
ncbi:peptide deformylase [Candidatus Odyssella acanthamoebae]|uniref:peptide deformylase n=1 Tax=Candidatus Odyssella acanthamoebae TaxID=91604 RepID=UPI00068E79D0|nr:peptide deformylase [Candidatus Paracaedibacter acanthamoebae]